MAANFFFFYIGVSSFTSQVALDYIGKRGATVGVTREKRIKCVLPWDLFSSLKNSILFSSIFLLNLCGGYRG